MTNFHRKLNPVGLIDFPATNSPHYAVEVRIVKNLTCEFLPTTVFISLLGSRSEDSNWPKYLPNSRLDVQNTDAGRLQSLRRRSLVNCFADGFLHWGTAKRHGQFTYGCFCFPNNTVAAVLKREISGALSLCSNELIQSSVLMLSTFLSC